MDFDLHGTNGKKLRYGENPHQEGWFYEVVAEKSDPFSIQNFQVLQGKELSYNNYLDMDGALFALSHMGGNEAGCVIVKHTNPCGASLKNTIEEAYQAAWYDGDPLAAFGGVMACNREVGKELAEKMIENFFEILIAPSVTSDALAVFNKKPNLRVLVNPLLTMPSLPHTKQIHKIRGGILVQDPDVALMTSTSLKNVTKRTPTEAERDDMIFAWAICRSTKSNTVVAVRGKTLIASGAGQQDRKRCAELCVSKSGGTLKGSVAASDGFFPFPDGLKVLTDAGVTAVIQPGGSIKDVDVIQAADEAGVAMVFTGTRAFRH